MYEGARRHVNGSSRLGITNTMEEETMGTWEDQPPCVLPPKPQVHMVVILLGAHGRNISIGSTHTCEKSIISVATFYNERRPQPLRTLATVCKKLQLQN